MSEKEIAEYLTKIVQKAATPTFTPQEAKAKLEAQNIMRGGLYILNLIREYRNRTLEIGDVEVLIGLSSVSPLMYLAMTVYYWNGLADRLLSYGIILPHFEVYPEGDHEPDLTKRGEWIQKVIHKVLLTDQELFTAEELVKAHLWGTPQYKQDNPMQEVNRQGRIQEWLKEEAGRIEELRHAKHVVLNYAQQNLEELLNYPMEITALSSIINSWNSIAVELTRNDYPLATFERIPESPPHERSQWIQKLINGKFLTDEEINEQAILVNKYLRQQGIIIATKYNPCEFCMGECSEKK